MIYVLKHAEICSYNLILFHIISNLIDMKIQYNCFNYDNDYLVQNTLMLKAYSNLKPDIYF